MVLVELTGYGTIFQYHILYICDIDRAKYP
jgi:hypothetical protein